MQNTVIDFMDVIKTCESFVACPSKTDKMEKLFADLRIRTFLTMDEKVLCLYKMIIDTDAPVDIHPSIFTAKLELASLFDGLLVYTNIDTNIPKELKIYETYDLLYQSGLVDYILEYCEKDYTRLIRLMERTLSYSNLLELMNSITKIDDKEIQRAISEFKQMKNNMTPEMLHDLANIVQFNNPDLYAIKNNLIDTALEQAERAHQASKTSPTVEETAN